MSVPWRLPAKDLTPQRSNGPGHPAGPAKEPVSFFDYSQQLFSQCCIVQKIADLVFYVWHVRDTNSASPYPAYAVPFKDFFPKHFFPSDFATWILQNRPRVPARFFHLVR